jgi:hypothetical protein
MSRSLLRALPCLRMLPLALVVATTACAAFGPAWTPVGGAFAAKRVGVTADLPEGWMLNRGARNAVQITRDGFALQAITVASEDLKDPSSDAIRRFTPGMLPQEASRVDADIVRFTDGVTNFSLLDNEPATIDGHRCYRLAYEYRVSAGLKRRAIRYGCVIGDRLYRLVYGAAALHYFDRDAATFEHMIGTVHFTDLP